jgi:hypothetical protein
LQPQEQNLIHYPRDQSTSPIELCVLCASAVSNQFLHLEKAKKLEAGDGGRQLRMVHASRPQRSF